MEFEPWTGEIDDVSHWQTVAKDHLVTVRLALAMMYRTKPQLIEGIEAMDDNAGNQMLDGFQSAREFFETCLSLLDGAWARLICASSVIELRNKPQ